MERATEMPAGNDHIRGHHVSSIKDLRALRRRILILPDYQVTAFLHFRQLSGAQARAWEQVLARDLSACGCPEGAALAGAALLGYLTFLLAGLVGMTDLTWRAVMLGAVAVPVSGLIGKIAGLVKAQIRLRYHLTVLEHVLGRSERTVVENSE